MHRCSRITIVGARGSTLGLPLENPALIRHNSVGTSLGANQMHNIRLIRENHATFDAMPDHWDDEAIEPLDNDEKYQAWLAAGAPPGKPPQAPPG